MHVARACAVAIAIAGCAAPVAPLPEVFEPVFEHLSAGLLSVWGRSAEDVFTVGSDDGAGPMVLHFDGAGWARLHTGETGGLWWVHGFGEGPSGPVFMGGDGGMILRYADGAFTRFATPGTGTVFGIWGDSPSDVLAVGGTMGADGFAWHFDGTRWTALTLPPGFAGESLFKVWGLAHDDAWIVGAGGVILHYDGTALTSEVSPTRQTLFTTHAIPGRTVAVGGAGNGVLLERGLDGVWTNHAPRLAATLIGVWLDGDAGWAVGASGQVLRERAGRWELDDTSPGLGGNALHSVWVDPEGGVWAAGGQVLVVPIGDGVLLHRGRAIPGGTFSP